jgi:hypothetical protein
MAAEMLPRERVMAALNHQEPESWGRVEHWPPAGRSGLSVPAPFVWRCLTSPTVRDLQHPLIEPDVRFSRIRLSEHLHREADAGA